VVGAADVAAAVVAVVAGDGGDNKQLYAEEKPWNED
jgi:hypothetical protein